MKHQNTEELASFIEKTNRRRALKTIGLGALATAAFKLDWVDGQAMAAGQTLTLPRIPTPSPEVQASLDFALNLEYLEANFYCYATTGQGIESQGVAITGVGTQGTVNAPSSARVSFSNPAIAAYAEELAVDEIAHVNFLRALATAGGLKPVAQPSIDLVNSFNTAASAAGLGSSFSPFDSSAGDLDFLLGAFIFEDVGVTAYYGALPPIQDSVIITGASGIMGTEAYHAGTVRNEIYKLGTAAIAAAGAISNARNALGGEGIDQVLEFAGMSNTVPTDANALVFARTARLVENIVYLGINATKGGFFPNGMNHR
jgi:Ferritin-like domain